MKPSRIVEEATAARVAAENIAAAQRLSYRRLIVSRHPAATAFIREACRLPEDTPLVETAGPDDVRGAIVYGNIPLHLAAMSAAVVAVEFATPPRGAEYDRRAMEAAGVRLRLYRVSAPSFVCVYGVDDHGNDVPSVVLDNGMVSVVTETN